MDLTETYSWKGRDVAWSRIGSGDPVVFCHGTPWSSKTWAHFADALSRDFCVYLWDMPGYGQSSKHPEHDVDLATQGELFTDLLAEWNVDAPHVVAHDFGGAVSLRALLLRGAHFASLCLVDVVALRPWGSPFFRLVHDHTDVFAALPPAVHAGALAAYIQTTSSVSLLSSGVSGREGGGGGSFPYLPDKDGCHALAQEATGQLDREGSWRPRTDHHYRCSWRLADHAGAGVAGVGHLGRHG